MVSTKKDNGATIRVASVIHHEVDPELGEVPDLEGCCQRQGVQDVNLGEDLSEDQHRAQKDLIRRYRDVFTDMPRETDKNKIDRLYADKM